MRTHSGNHFKRQNLHDHGEEEALQKKRIKLLYTSPVFNRVGLSPACLSFDYLLCHSEVRNQTNSLQVGTWRSTIFGSLAAIAIDRYQHVVHHFESLKSTKGSRTPLVLMAWLYAALTSFPLAIGVKNVPVVSISEA
ncbi:unnamed protein product [Pocillopora meandrina]|uniref:Uncharacterized protein n=1 Tax=Pocillopora meandrina TaxID=46732 RepID=A0AAU9VPK7_9CNID|nr:unnamed protein product [Pocillopora meandrina]